MAQLGQLLPAVDVAVVEADGTDAGEEPAVRRRVIRTSTGRRIQRPATGAALAVAQAHRIGPRAVRTAVARTVFLYSKTLPTPKKRSI